MKQDVLDPGIYAEGRNMLVVPPKYPSTEVKEHLGGRWNKDREGWVLPPTSLNVLKLEEWYGAEFVDTAPDVLRDLARLPWGFEGWSEEELSIAAEHPAWETLYPFQREAVEYLVTNPHGCALLGLSPGLGKTPTSIVAADLLGLERILVLAPVSLTANWKNEIAKWASTGRDVTHASAADRSVGPGVTVANHEVIQEVVLRDEDGNVERPDWRTNAKAVKEWIAEGPTKVNEKGRTVPKRERIVQAAPQYAEVEWDLIVCDESLLLKNRKAVKTDVLKPLSDRAGNVWLLSGSPTSKFNDDLFRQLQLMFPRGFTSYWRFAEQFCVVEKGQWGWSITGDRPGVDPKHYLRDFLFMRDQEDVLPDLPDYVTKHVPVEFTKRQAKAYDSMLEDWIVELEDADPDALVGDDVALETTNRVGQLVRLQQITSNLGTLPKQDEHGVNTGEYYPRGSGKEDALVQLIKEGEIELPLLVWAWWVPTAASIAERLAKEFNHLRVGKVTGADKTAHKHAEIESYKEGNLDVLVLQMNVGKYGHTLTNTKTVYYHDRSWDADAWIQSLRRVRRIGLKHVPVLYVPQIESSADELVELNLLGKVESISKLTNGSLLELLLELRSK